MAHSQNGNALVCGLSTRKMRTPCSIQYSNTLASSIHSSRQCFGLEVERIDVLVFLRRVLGVLDAAVGALAEPLGMRLDVRMVGRALERDVERDLDAVLAAACASRRRKSSSVPSAGRIALCPPSSAPMAHGLPTSSGRASSVLFGPLRRSRPIGWIGGKYSTSKPRRATYGSSASTSAKVPCRAGSFEAERGNSSYQVE